MGVYKNIAKSIKSCERSARRCYGLASYELGSLYSKSEGVSCGENAIEGPGSALNAPTDKSTAPIAFIDLKAQYARIKKQIDARIAVVLEHGRFIDGPEVAEFEAVLAASCGAKHCVAVSSGTDALLAALMAEGIGPGNGVFVPAFTFPVTAEVILLLGAVPIFADIDKHSFNLDATDAARRIEATKDLGRITPKALSAVNLFGLPANYPQLAELCREHDLFYLTDAAQSFGARLGERKVGTLAPVIAVSFYPAKPLGCYGNGGAILTDDDERAERFRSIRAHGWGAEKYEIVRVGLNAQLDTLQAAILLATLEVFDEEISARTKVANSYDVALSRSGVELPRRIHSACSTWAHYKIQTRRRNKLADMLREDGIHTAVYYPAPLHLQPAYRKHGAGPGSLPISEALSERVLSLPMHPYMSEALDSHIGSRLESALERIANERRSGLAGILGTICKGQR